MIRAILIFILLAIVFCISRVVIADDSYKWELLPKVEKGTKEELRTLSDYYADKYSVSRETMSKVVVCESGWNIKAVGDNGESIGLVQIHLPSHPTVSKLQAESPYFALEFLAKALSKNQGRMWTCYRDMIQ